MLSASIRRCNFVRPCFAGSLEETVIKALGKASLLKFKKQLFSYLKVWYESHAQCFQQQEQ